MKQNEPSFHRSTVIVALLHLGCLALLIYFFKTPKKTGEQITWVETGSFAALPQAGEENSSSKQDESSQDEEPSQPIVQAQEAPAPQPAVEPTPEPEPTPTPLPEPVPEQAATPPPPVESEIPIATPPPQQPPEPTPAPKPIPKPTPKPLPKPKPKVTPKPSPKPKPKPKLKEKEEEEEPTPPKPKPKNSSAHKPTSTSTSHKKKATASGSKPAGKKEGGDHGNDSLKKAFLTSKDGSGNGKGTAASGNGSGSHGDGVNAGILAGYHELIHDRFYSQWEQPTAIPTEHRHDFVCTLHLTIERDGTISNFSLAKPSGNPIMDESVLAAASKVKQIAPLPEGLSQNAPYTVNINFELE